MAWPGTLTTEQQTALQALCTNCRSWGKLLWQLNNLGWAIGSAWSGGLSSALSTSGMSSTDTIPNTSGLAGSQDLSVADLNSLAAWAQALANSANADQGTGAYASVGIQQTVVKAAGVDNVVGNG